MSVYVDGAIACDPALITARVGTVPTSLPSSITINNAYPHFAPLTCSQTSFYPQNGEGTYVVGFNVTDPCSGTNTGATHTVTVTCSNRLPANNVTVEWVWSPTTPTYVQIIGTVSSCFNAAAGFFNVISAPLGSGYTAGQSLTPTATNNYYYSYMLGPLSVIGPYALVFSAYDNCAVYHRNITVYYDGAIIHVLPPVESLSTTCDGPLAPVKIASSPIKAAIWQGRTNQFGVSSISTVLTVRASAGDEAVSYQWGLNATDGSEPISIIYPSTTSVTYVFGNISSSASTKVVSWYPVSYTSELGGTIYSTGVAPLSGIHKPFSGSPAQGMYQGTISRQGYLSREMQTTTVTNTSMIITNTTAGVTVLDQTCTVTLTWSASSYAMQISAAVGLPSTTITAAHFNYMNAAAKCVGTYMINVKTLDAARCSSSDYDWFMMDCGPAPQPVLSPCDATTVAFRHADRTFRWGVLNQLVTLDTSLTTDPYTGITRTPICCIQYTSVPIASSLYGTIYCGQCTLTTWQPSSSFVFDVAGSYGITLHASNYCASRKVTHTYTVTCASYDITASINATATSLVYDGSTGTSVGTTWTQSSTSSVTDSTVGGSLTAVWSIVSQPTLPSWVITQIGTTSTSIASPTALSTQISMRYSGTSTIRLTSSIGCGQTSTTTQTLTMTCGSSLSASAGSPQVVTDTCGTGWSTVTMTGTTSHAPTPAAASYRYQWTLLTVPVGSTLKSSTVASITTTQTFIPDVIGDYVWVFQAYDYCSIAAGSVTITAAFAPTPIADIDITATPSVINSKDIVSLVATSDVTWSYFWNITSWPSGVTPSTAVAQVVGTTSTATFVGVVGGTYVVSLTITTACGAKKTQTISLTVDCPYVLTAVVLGSVSGSSNTTAASVVTTWPENNIWRQVILTGTTSDYGARAIGNITADWVVITAPLGSLWQPVVNVTNSTNTYNNVINSTHTLQSIRSYMTVTKTWAHVSPSVLAPLEACFQPDMPGTYTIEMRITDGCRAATSTVTIIAACNAPPVAIISRRGGLPPLSSTSISQIASSTDTSLQSTTPPSDGSRMYLDASQSYSSVTGVKLTYYWTWLSPSSKVLAADQGIDPPYGPKILLSPPYPSNSTLILYVSDGCTLSTARVLVSCGSDVSPSLSSLATSASVDPYSRTTPEFVLTAGVCYPQEATKWHLVSFTPTVRDFTLEAQATKLNGGTSRYPSVTTIVMTSFAVVLAMISMVNH